MDEWQFYNVMAYITLLFKIGMRNNFENKKVRSEQMREEDSIQQNYGEHMQMMRILHANSKAYQKISKSYFDIKTSIITICQGLQQTDHFTGISHAPAKTLLEIFCQANASIADHCRQFSLQLQNLSTMYSEMAKQQHSKYRQQKNNFSHYVEKVKNLAKSDELDRYERNQQKLKSAKNSYLKKSKQFNVFLKQTNEEASKIWQKNFISFLTTLVNKYSHTLKDTQSLFESEDSQQIILDEEDCDIHFSPKNSFKSITKNDNLHEKVQKILMKTNPQQSVKLQIKEVFKQKINNTNQASYNSTNSYDTDKLFGINSLKLPSNPVYGNKLVQSFNIELTKKSSPQNDFSFFDNILSQKSQPQILSTELGTLSSSNFFTSKPTGRVEKVDNNAQLSLLDL